MSEKLKPCPFCGGEAELKIGRAFSWAQCTNEKCQCECVPFAEYENVINAWNTRQERICRMEWNRLELCFMGSCGNEYFDTVLPNYCDNCGGKIVEVEG